MTNRTILTIVAFLSIVSLVMVTGLFLKLRQTTPPVNQPEVFQQAPSNACETTFTLSPLKTCGQSPCTSNSDCAANLVCTDNGYCSMPAYEAACNANPSTATCCQAPATPSPVPTPTPLGATPTPTPSPSPTPLLSSLGDYVWHDVDRDGIQDTNEVGIPGVTVRLLNSTGTTLSTTTTNSTGYYLFPNLQPGTYMVEFVKPSQYTFTSQDQGTNNAIDSDANVVTGRTTTINLPAGVNDMTWDAGLYLPSTTIPTASPSPIVYATFTPYPTVSPSVTPTPIFTPTATSTPTPTTPPAPPAPELPQAGGLPPTLLFTLGGIILVVLGLLF